jgi:hypothetical protein
MKTVVLNQDTNIVEVCNVDDYKYYGTVKKASPKEKGFIVRTLYGASNGRSTYKLMSINYFTKGNSFELFDGYSLPGLIKELLKNNSFDIYEFDTPQELFRWLAE